ncbi:MAG: hypothetical protein Q9225_006860, partial [Loekoesia sp. 1 TL-2023]
MVSTTCLRAAAAVASLCSLSIAQVATSCNPLKGICPNDKGLAASTYSIDFSTIKSWPSEWTLADSENVTFGPQGAEFTFAKRYDAPTMWTNFKFFFGRVEFVVKAAPGTGIVSSMVLLSDDLDEIDWEFLGGATSTVQTNYFGKGYTGSYNRSTTPAVANPQTTFYTYTLDWSPTSLVWSIDGKAVRTLKAADADGNGSQYPQSPMKVSLSLWDAGDPDAATQVWGGGVTPIPPPEPYTMYVKSVKIWNTNPAEQYQYMDQSGSYKSIKIIKDTSVSSSSSLSSTQTTETLSLGSTSVRSTVATSKVSSSRSSGQSISSRGPSTAGSMVSSSSNKAVTTQSATATALNISNTSKATGTSSITAHSTTASLQAPETPKKQTVYSTQVVTITSCHPTVTFCPATTSPYVTISLVPIKPTATSAAIPASVSSAPSASSSIIPNTTASIGKSASSSTSSSAACSSCHPASNSVSGTNTASCNCTASSTTAYLTVTAFSVQSAISSTAVLSSFASSVIPSATGSSISPVVVLGPGSSSMSLYGVNTSWLTMFTTGSRTLTIMATPASSSASGSASSQASTAASISQDHLGGSSSKVVIAPNPTINKPPLASESTSMATSTTPNAVPISSLPNTSAYWISMSRAYAPPASGPSSMPADSPMAVGAQSPSASVISIMPNDTTSTGTAYATSSATVTASSSSSTSPTPPAATTPQSIMSMIVSPTSAPANGNTNPGVNHDTNPSDASTRLTSSTPPYPTGTAALGGGASIASSGVWSTPSGTAGASARMGNGTM